jgi:hypothetical protein
VTTLTGNRHVRSFSFHFFFSGQIDFNSSDNRRAQIFLARLVIVRNDITRAYLDFSGRIQWKKKKNRAGEWRRRGKKMFTKEVARVN